ncbi:protein containing Periplasmic binding protein/LacI transcriptional regulator domain protein, partial [gut metagenome]
TEETMTLEEQKQLIEQEISKGTDGLIVQPVPGEDTEKMLKKLEKRVPIILVESVAAKNQENSLFPVVEPQHYEMGFALAKELLKDYNNNVTGKTFGLFSEDRDTEAIMERERGFKDALEMTGGEIRWCASEDLEEQEEVDFVIALDDKSLIHVGSAASMNHLYGSLVYGIRKIH